MHVFLSKKNTSELFDYMIDGIVVNRVTSIRDLGVLFDQKMKFFGHIDYFDFKAYSMLGFTLRICSEFKDLLKSVLPKKKSVTDSHSIRQQVLYHCINCRLSAPNQAKCICFNKI